MKDESIDYLDRIACIANANLAYQKKLTPGSRTSASDTDMESSMALLMSAFLEMYEHWKHAKPGTEPPSERIYVAADTCILMRNQLHSMGSQRWSDEAQGLFQIVTAFMFLFKHMYVPQY